MRHISISTKFFLDSSKEIEKKYIHPPILHQALYQSLTECFSKHIPIHKIPNILNEENIDVVIDEIFNNKDIAKSNTEIET